MVIDLGVLGQDQVVLLADEKDQQDPVRWWVDEVALGTVSWALASGLQAAEEHAGLGDGGPLAGHTG